MSRGASSSRRVRRLAIGAGIALLLCAVLVAALPAIVSATLLPGIVRDAVAPRVRGTVVVHESSVSWSGPQVFRVAVKGEHDAVDATISVHNGLLALARSSGPLDVRVAAAVDTASRDDGSITLPDLLQPASAGGAGSSAAASKPTVPDAPFSLPAIARGSTLTVDPLALTITPLGGGSPVRIEGASASIALRDGDATVKAKGSTTIGAERGSFDLDATLRGLVGKDGTVTVATAGVDLALKASSLPVSAGAQQIVVRSLDVDAKAESLARLLDARFEATLEAKGSAPSGATGRVRFNGLLTTAGTLSSKATASGQVALGNVPTAVLAPFLHGTGIDAVRDLGPSLVATIDFDGPGATLTARSDRFALSGSARLDDASGQAIVQDLVLDTTLAKPLLTGFGVPVRSDVPVSIRVERAVVPLEGSPVEGAQAIASIAMKGVALDGIAQAKDGLVLGDVTIGLRTARLADRVQVDVALAGGVAQGSLAAFIMPRFDAGAWAGARVEVQRSSIAASVGNEWLDGTGITLRRPAAVTLAIDGASITLERSAVDVGSASIDAALSIEPVSVGGVIGPDAWLDVASTRIGVRSQALSKGAQVAVVGGASGFAAKADLTLSKFMDQSGAITADAAQVNGSIQVDAIDLSRVPHVPERMQRMSGLVGLGRPVLAMQVDGSTQSATAQVTLKGPAAELSTQVQWTPARTVVRELKGWITVSDGLPELLDVEGVRIAAPAKLALAAEELVILTPAPAPSAVEVKAEKLTLGIDRIELSACPGLDRGIVLERVDVAGSATRTAGGDLAWSGSLGATVPGELEVRSQASLTMPASGAPGGSATVKATLPAGTAMIGRFSDSAFLPLAAGPGTLDLAWTGSKGIDELKVSAALARLTATIEAVLDPAPPGGAGRGVRVPTATVSLRMPRGVLDRMMAGREPDAASWTGQDMVPIDATLKGVTIGADRRSVALSLDASVGACSLAPSESLRVGLEQTRITAAIAALEQGARLSVASDVSIDGGAKQPASLELDLRGDLRGMLAADGAIDVRGSTAKLSAPGALVQPFLASKPVAARNAAAPAAAPKGGAFNASGSDRIVLDPKARIDAALDLRRITVPARLADAGIDATVTVGAVDAAFGPVKLHIERIGADVKAASLGRSCAFDATVAFGAKGSDGTVNAKGTIDALGQPDGGLATATMALRAQAQAKAIPLAWVDALAATDGIVTRACGDRADATIDAVSPAPGTIDLSATLDTTYLDARMPRIKVAGGFVQVDQDKPVELALVLNDAIRHELLEPVNPILSDVKDAPPVKVTLARLRWPTDGNLARLDADARVEVGDVTVVKNNQLLGVLQKFKSSASPTVPANIGPLAATVRAGQLTYRDFIIGVDRTGMQWQLVLNFSGDIDLTRDPAWARAISARYPASSIVRTVAGVAGGISSPVDETIADISNALNMLPMDLGNLLAVEITFSGPLGPVDGKTVPLDTAVHPVIGKLDPIKGAGQVIDALDGLFGKPKQKPKQGQQAAP